MTAFERVRHRDLVGVLNVTSRGNARGDSRDLHLKAAERARKPACSGLALKRRTGRQDYLVNLASLNASHQRSSAQLLRTHSVKRRKGSVQHVVNAVVPAPLHGFNVGRLFDNANQALVSRGARAVGAGIHVGDVVAYGA